MAALLLASTSFSQDGSGSEAAGAFVADLASALAERLEVVVVAPGREARIEDDGPFTVHRFAVPQQPLSLLKPSDPRHWKAIVGTLRAGDAALAQVVESRRISHILALWALPTGFWAMRAQERFNVPYSIWALGSDIWSMGQIPGVRQVLARVLRNCSGLFADGHGLSAEVERIAGRACAFMPSARALDCPVSIARPTSPPYRFAYLGRWHTNKGVDLLLDAVSALDESDWSQITEFRVAGGGPLAERVERDVQRLKSAGRPVELLGYLGKQEALELLSWADYLMIPSRIESIPVVLSDALQCGCPVVASPVGDLPLLVSRYRMGVLAPSADAQGLRNAIRAALDSSAAEFQAGMDEGRSAFDVREIAGRLLDTLGLSAERK